MEAENKKNIVWQAYEYRQREMTKEDKIAVIIATIAAITGSIFVSNLLLAIILALVGGLVIVFANKKPEYITFVINEDGIIIKDKLHPIKAIKEYNISESKDKRCILTVETDNIIYNTISIPIKRRNAVIIEDYFKNKGKSRNKELELSLYEIIAQYF